MKRLSKEFPGLSILFVAGKWAGFHAEIYPIAFRIVFGWFCVHVSALDYDRLADRAMELTMPEKANHERRIGMTHIPPITIKVNFDDLNTINDERLLWELCQRHTAATAARKTKRFVKHVVISLPIGPDHTCNLVMSENAYNALMGKDEVL